MSGASRAENEEVHWLRKIQNLVSSFPSISQDILHIYLRLGLWIKPFGFGNTKPFSSSSISQPGSLCSHQADACPSSSTADQYRNPHARWHHSTADEQLQSLPIWRIHCPLLAVCLLLQALGLRGGCRCCEVKKPDTFILYAPGSLSRNWCSSESKSFQACILSFSANL